ncbi:MAG: peptidoglycan-binding protein [Gammaproteobacteria bacterium]|nr:MAG: peptidoglycan-binding protein [Gammaproteobacteria bacterium]
MDIKNPFKLEKLKITKHDPEATPNLLDDTNSFEVMFNPESFTRQYGNKVQTGAGLGSATGTTEAIPAGSLPEKLELHLVIDGTGVSDFGLPIGLGGKTQDVKQQIDAFLEICYLHHGEQHAPNIVKVKWGIIDFTCRLESVNITYKSFDRAGQPLRAELDVIFTEHSPTEEQDSSLIPASQEAASPDLTHTHIVIAGDTLPLLTKKIYGSSHYYLQVAEVNNLNHFRALHPGQALIFPPLEK